MSGAPRFIHVIFGRGTENWNVEELCGIFKKCSFPP
jgi:hypothetical protein